jgi:hypothetical protein
MGTNWKHFREEISKGSYSLYKDFELSVNVDKHVGMKISWKTGNTENVKCNNCETKSGSSESKVEQKIQGNFTN